MGNARFPNRLRKLLDVYRGAGFTPIRWEFRKGSHVKLWFDEMPEPLFTTINTKDPHGIANNIARLHRLVRSHTAASTPPAGANVSGGAMQAGQAPPRRRMA